MGAPDLRLGIDAGAEGVHVAVVDRPGRVVAKATVGPSPDLGDGVRRAIAALGDGVDRGRVASVMLSTTELTARIVERRGVASTAVLRIGAPLTLAVPPLHTWPQDLRRSVSAGEAVVRGGARYDGTVAVPLDADAVARFAAGVAGRAQGVAITGVFSGVVPDQELEARDVVRRELGDEVTVAMGHEAGGLGLIDRESATVLNAALAPAAADVAAVLAVAIPDSGIVAEPFLGQHDGTLMGPEHATRFPLLMVGAGAAASIRGAAHLGTAFEGVVIDAGERSAYAGVLAQGSPRAVADAVVVGGVRLRIRAPETCAIEVGSAPQDTVGEEALRRAIERVSAALAPPQLIAVGRGLDRLPARVTGIGEIRRPADGDVAGAVGLAMAPVTAHVELLCADMAGRARAVAAARAAAVERAVHAGADPAAVEVVEIDELPVAGLARPAIRIGVRAAGQPDIRRS